MKKNDALKKTTETVQKHSAGFKTFYNFTHACIHI